MKLFNEVKKWEEIEIPRREREKFVQKTTNVFPDILDHLMLEGEDGEES